MRPEDLRYENLVDAVLSGYVFDGRTESASFLAWFLENILRIDDVEAADAICDGPGDRGIDAIYVDHDSNEVIFLQSKVRQREGRVVGDQPVRDFAGSIAQFRTKAAIEAAIEAEPNSELSRLLVRSEAADRIAEEYTPRGYFVTNSVVDDSGRRAAEALGISIYDRSDIAERYIEIGAPDRVLGVAQFDVSDNGYLEFNAGGVAKLYLITAKATDLLGLAGIADGSLFAQNVRLSLGNTKVNKDIAKTLENRAKHILFPMYHNGVTIICRRATVVDEDRIEIEDYVVVNGAQSLSVLFRNQSRITNDLRVIAKVIEIAEDDGFASDITTASNNQNAIKPRDRRSTNKLQTRLQSEFENIDYEDYRYLIKRGEEPRGRPISNEEAGRMLLAFDLQEPWSCHQIYKVFEDKYSEIFGRPIVDAWRIIFLDKIMERIENAIPEIRNEPLQRYRLTRYFLLYCLANLLKEDQEASELVSDCRGLVLDEDKLDILLASLEGIVRRLCVDLRFEFIEDDNAPDYKSALKSPSQVANLEKRLRRSFMHDVARGREELPSASF